MKMQTRTKAILISLGVVLAAVLVMAQARNEQDQVAEPGSIYITSAAVSGSTDTKIIVGLPTYSEQAATPIAAGEVGTSLTAISPGRLQAARSFPASPIAPETSTTSTSLGTSTTTTTLKQEPQPQVKVYLEKKEVVEGVRPVTSMKPGLAIELAIADPYSLGDYSVTVNNRRLTFADQDRKKGQLRATIILDSLNPGSNTIVITANSSGADGQAATATKTISFDTEDIAGPVRVIGTPLALPSPFNPTVNNKVTIQYRLSKDAAIRLHLLASAGQTAMLQNYREGEEGGRTGYNNVTWDGKLADGQPAASGLYVGQIISLGDNRSISSFKVMVTR